MHAAVTAEMTPQTIIYAFHQQTNPESPIDKRVPTHVGRYRAGLPSLLSSKLDGICISRYPTKRILMDVWNSTGVRLRSRSMPASFAAAMLFLSSCQRALSHSILSLNIPVNVIHDVHDDDGRE